MNIILSNTILILITIFLFYYFTNTIVNACLIDSEFVGLIFNENCEYR